MKNIVPPKEEICINGKWYRAGEEYDAPDAPKKPEQKKKTNESEAK
jgi:hypothetical protein